MNGKKIIILLILLVFPSFSFALTNEDRNLHFEALALIRNDPEKLITYLETLEEINADLSDEEELSKVILTRAGALGVDTKSYKNIKFANVEIVNPYTNEIINDGDRIFNLNYIILLAILAFVIYKYYKSRKNKSNIQEINN